MNHLFSRLPCNKKILAEAVSVAANITKDTTKCTTLFARGGFKIVILRRSGKELLPHCLRRFHRRAEHRQVRFVLYSFCGLLSGFGSGLGGDLRAAKLTHQVLHVMGQPLQTSNQTGDFLLGQRCLDHPPGENKSLFGPCRR